MEQLDPVTYHKTQIYLNRRRFDVIKEEAERQDTSMAAVIRACIDFMFRQTLVDSLIKRSKAKEQEAESEWSEFFALAGIGSSGRGDISRKHDEYLTAAEIASWK